MLIQQSNKYFSKNLYKLVLTVASTSLLTVLSMTSISVQAAGLNDLFKNSSTAKSKFLPLEESFQFVSNTEWHFHSPAVVDQFLNFARALCL